MIRAGAEPVQPSAPPPPTGGDGPAFDNGRRYNGRRYNGKQGTGEGTAITGQCLNCGGEYLQTVWNKKFCSEGCKAEYHASQHGGQPFNPKQYHKKGQP